MPRRPSPHGPHFVTYFWPVIDALKQLGGSARPAEVCDKIAQSLKISEEKRAEPLSSGYPRFDNEVAWARFYLARAGIIDSSRHGVWTLTEKGRSLDKLPQPQAVQLFRDVHGRSSQDREVAETEEQTGEQPAPAETQVEAATNYRQMALEVLRELPPAGFERFCQRLLRESGFQEVTVTGRSRDGGIDGIGVLQVNPLVSFKVLFQCKRYSGLVIPTQVRDFRGAMMGRADKGIILTTGSFTIESRREALRDGVPPIELVDGEQLVNMLENLELGLKPIKSFTLDLTFFEQFKN